MKKLFHSNSLSHGLSLGLVLCSLPLAAPLNSAWAQTDLSESTQEGALPSEDSVQNLLENELESDDLEEEENALLTEEATHPSLGQSLAKGVRDARQTEYQQRANRWYGQGGQRPQEANPEDRPDQQNASAEEPTFAQEHSSEKEERTPRRQSLKKQKIVRFGSLPRQTRAERLGQEPSAQITPQVLTPPQHASVVSQPSPSPSGGSIADEIPFEEVPAKHRGTLRKRLKLIKRLILKHRRAYDYRNLTNEQIAQILAELDRRNPKGRRN